MPSDSDPIYAAKKPDDMMTMLNNMIGDIPFKFLFLIFVVFLLISSDTFISRVLGKFDGAVELRCPTSYGTLIQGLVLVLVCMIVDGGIKQGII